MHFKCDCFYSGRRSLFGAFSCEFGAWAGTDWGGVGAPEAQSFARGNRKVCASIGERLRVDCAVNSMLVFVKSHFLLCFAFVPERQVQIRMGAPFMLLMETPPHESTIARRNV